MITKRVKDLVASCKEYCELNQRQCIWLELHIQHMLNDQKDERIEELEDRLVAVEAQLKDLCGTKAGAKMANYSYGSMP